MTTTDIVGPASAVNSTPVRPSDGRQWTGTDTWFRDCSTPNSDDGTEVDAAWLNGVTGLFRNIIRANGVDQDGVTPVVPPDQSDNMAINAIAALYQRARPIYAVDTGAPGNIIAALAFAPAEILPGMKFRVKIANDVPGPTTINLNGLGTFPVTTPHGSPLAYLDYLAGDTLEMTVIVAAGGLAFASVTPIHFAEIRSPQAFTVHGGGTFPDLYAVAAWISRRRIATTGSLTFTCAAGKFTYSGGILSLYHPDGIRIAIAGAAPKTAAPLLTAFAATGNAPASRATDTATNLALVRTWLATELDFQGSSGLDIRTIGAVANLLVVGDLTAACDGVTARFGYTSLSNLVAANFANRGIVTASAPGSLSNVFGLGCGGNGISIEGGSAFSATGSVGGFNCGAYGVFAVGGVLTSVNGVGFAGSGNAADGLSAASNGYLSTGQTAASFANFNLNGVSASGGGKVSVANATAANNSILNFNFAASDLVASNNLADVASIASALANLGFRDGISPTGYVKIPVGGRTLIIQWGTATPPSGASVYVPFPTTFPTGCLGAPVLTAVAQSTTLFAGQAYGASASGFNATLFSVTSSGGSSLSAVTFGWIAIGC